MSFARVFATVMARPLFVLIALFSLAGCGLEGQEAGDAGGIVTGNIPENPVFACGTGVETDTGDTLPGSYTLFEAGQSRPLAISPNGRYLFLTNTPANCLEIYNIEQDSPRLISSVSVGLEPVAVAARSDTEVWVVNALSDSVSIVEFSNRPHVTRTLLVGDEPRDIVFGGVDKSRAFITAAFRGQNHPTFLIDDMFTAGIGRGDVWVFDSGNPGSGLGGTPLTIINLFTDAPRALAVTDDGLTVYAAGFMTGNQTTTIDQTSAAIGGKPGPAQNIEGITAPDTGLIVKYNGTDWVDETGKSWSSQVKFSLPDQDVFVIDASLSTPTLIGSRSGVGTTLFNMATAPDGRLFVSNTEARNQVRFEGEGSFATTVRGHIAENRVTIIEGDSVRPFHLNKHIDFDLPFGQQVPAADKQRSIAQPGGMVYYNNELWVLSFGSNKVHIYTDPAVSSGNWFETPLYITLPGGGPSGIVIQEDRKRAYIYSRFNHAITVVSTDLKTVLDTHSLFSPEPASVINGRPFLYDAQLTSGNGTASCASCHIFGDFDGLAWDLGNPDDMVRDNPNDFLPASRPLAIGAQFHPMKGPMATQTLRGIADSGPQHWRGDRTGQKPVNGETIEEAAFKEFNGAFVGLVGRQTELTEPELQAFTDFALQITPPPNPVRKLDDSLTATQTTGENIYFNEQTTGLGGCNDCHRLDRAQKLFGTSGQSTFEGSGVSQFFKIPHLRNAYQKVGMFGTSLNNPNEVHGGPQIKGFGFLHDGAIDTLVNFFTSTFSFAGDPTIARKRVAEYALVFDSNLKPIVGQQVTLTPDNPAVAGPRIDLLIARALAGDCDLVIWSSKDEFDAAVSGRLLPNGNFKLSVNGNTELPDSQIRSQVSTTGEPVTYTCVPPGNGVRISQVP